MAETSSCSSSNLSSVILSLLDNYFEQDCIAIDTSNDIEHVEPLPLCVMVSGMHASVGKSTICLGILASLLSHGVPASDLAYIKPVRGILRVFKQFLHSSLLLHFSSTLFSPFTVLYLGYCRMCSELLTSIGNSMRGDAECNLLLPSK